MESIDQQYARVANNILCLYLNVEFASTEAELRRSLGPKRLSRVYEAMRRPVMLSETLQSALDIYELQFCNVFAAHGGRHIEC